MANRIGRVELVFWFAVLIFGPGIALAALTNTPIHPERHPWLQAVWILAATLVIFGAIVSRFHDIGWTGWAVIVMAVPLVDLMALLFLMLAPGQKQSNLYGGPPLFLQRFRKVAKS